jgi:purine-binding chemotaxis protein CheW
VQEIKGWTRVTRIPNAPHYLTGVLNLRGAIVPIVDLRTRFGLDVLEPTKTTVTIVLSAETGDRTRVMGIVVDAVSDVLNVEVSDIQPAPELGAAAHTEFLQGLTTVDDEMVMLLDIDQLLSPDEMRDLDTVQ